MYSVAYSNMLGQRHKPYWGEDADQFDPDRFLDERVKKYLTPNPYIFVPFNAGPRIVSIHLFRCISSFLSILPSALVSNLRITKPRTSLSGCFRNMIT